jgi:hypothetical protein
MIENEYKRIENESGCDFIKELLVAVFMSHTQILQIISKDQTKKQNQLDIPKPEHFIHKCYINIGREFYKNPMFFYDGPEVSPIERHKNIPQSENVIATTINETIRQLLPVRRILKTYLQESYDIEQDDEEEKNTPLEKKPLSKNYQRNLREMVRKEVANYNAVKTDTFQTPSTPETLETPLETTLETPLETTLETTAEPINHSPETQTQSTNANLHIQIEPSLENTNDVIDLPELTLEYIENALSNQEYLSEPEDDDIENTKEKENIKKTLIESIELEEINSLEKNKVNVISEDKSQDKPLPPTSLPDPLPEPLPEPLPLPQQLQPETKRAPSPQQSQTPQQVQQTEIEKEPSPQPQPA